ncbi:hypothetical protein G9C85_00205 [Halorubellus sp. JP-L1]|uniref:hypothetical protein n=1 Tax=Halorubellus sp. JP-L1 TaxID=2715753 RepID=UPI00140AEB9B|nr:hypothetical protein [Halorubellus sp. JP-L1]NHN40060.1 hypothetical protein [Halorubellus sp. JP-L1]
MTDLRTIQGMNGSGYLSLPINWLRRNGYAEEGGDEVTFNGTLAVDTLGDGAILIRPTDDRGDLSQLEDCEPVERLAAQRAMNLMDNSGVSALSD